MARNTFLLTFGGTCPEEETGWRFRPKKVTGVSQKSHGTFPEKCRDFFLPEPPLFSPRLEVPQRRYAKRFFQNPIINRKKKTTAESGSYPPRNTSPAFPQKATIMAKYKLAFKKNPLKKDQPGKWYANPSTVNSLDTRAVTRAVTRNTTVAPTELETSMNLVCDGIPALLQQGNSVRIGSLGTLRLSFGSAGVENIDDFNAATMIKNIKIIFTPSKELKAAVREGLSFENTGVIEAGFIYSSVQDYKKYQMSDRPAGGGDIVDDPTA